jgi:group I intron endonuclease
MAVIYRITNMANGKYYIGSSDSFERRVWQHKYALKRGEHKNPRLQAAWAKYGEEMFVFEVLEQLPEGADVLQAEDKYLANAVGGADCYNVNTSATAPRRGVLHTAESKAKTSANRVGKHAGSNHYRYGKTLSAEVREKIGAAQRGKTKAPRTVSETGMAKIRANIEAGRSHKHWTGRTHTEEAREKMSRAIRAISPDGEVREYTSITTLRLEMDMTPSTINRALKSGQPLARGPRAGWRFEYIVRE